MSIQKFLNLCLAVLIALHGYSMTTQPHVLTLGEFYV